MRNDKLELAKKISDNVLTSLNESTTSDIAPFASLMGDIIYRVYSNSLVGDIADVQPLSTPSGKIGTLYSTYTGNDNQILNKKNIKVIKISDTAGYSVDSIITTASGTAKILYIESDGDVLVEILTGTILKGETLDNAGTILSVITNRTYASRIFSNYSNPVIFQETNEELNARTISFELIFNTIETVSRKLKSVFTQEAIDDLRNMYGIEVANELIVKEFASEIISEIDMEIINYLRTVATPSEDLVLSQSYGINGDIMAVGNDLYANIYKNSMRIAKDTKRRQNFFILGDSVSLALLMTNPLHVSPESDKKNTYYMGKLGEQYSLYLDPFTTDNYILIGYTDKHSEIGDSGLIYSPYTMTTIDAIDPDSGAHKFHHIVRYGYTKHPQDTGTGVADSIFFRTFNIDVSNLKNFVV